MTGARGARTAKPIDVLVSYDGPQLMLLESSRKLKMLAVGIRKEGMRHPFFGCEARERTVEKYFNERADLHYVFMNAATDFYYFFDLADTNRQTGEIKLTTATPKEADNEIYWPQVGIFANTHTSDYKIREEYPSVVEEFHIDGNWKANDFSHFYGKMADLYSFYSAINSVARGDSEGADLNYIKLSIQDRLWEGGGSYVGFYDSLFSRVQKSSPLEVESIQYASPGTLKLRGDGTVLSDISNIIDIFDKNAYDLHKQYTALYGTLKGERLLSAPRETQLKPIIGEFVYRETIRFANMLKVDKVSEIYDACDKNNLIFCKVLLSVYRRAKELHNFHAEGRVQIL